MVFLPSNFAHFGSPKRQLSALSEPGSRDTWANKLRIREYDIRAQKNGRKQTLSITIHNMSEQKSVKVKRQENENEWKLENTTSSGTDARTQARPRRSIRAVHAIVTRSLEVHLE